MPMAKRRRSIQTKNVKSEVLILLSEKDNCFCVNYG